MADVYVEEPRGVAIPRSRTTAVAQRLTPGQPELAHLIDARISADFDWRGRDALPLA